MIYYKELKFGWRNMKLEEEGGVMMFFNGCDGMCRLKNWSKGTCEVTFLWGYSLDLRASRVWVFRRMNKWEF